MRRYWIEKDQAIYDSNSKATEVLFDDENFHHIFEVCRQEVGLHFEVILGDGYAYLVEVTEKGKKKARAKVIEARKIENIPAPHIHLALSVSRYQVMDSIVEKSVEMGVQSIHTFCSEYSFIRRPDNLPEGKLDRWKKIVKSATQQSGRGHLMNIEAPISWSDMLKQINHSPDNLCLFAYEGKSLMDIKTFLKSSNFSSNNDKLQSPPQNIWIIVGSEGGFSELEVREMTDLGLHPVTLGSQVLRVETACMTLVSVLKYEFGLLK